MGFFDKGRKRSEDNENIIFDDVSPKFWISTGNFLLNRIISGRWNGGIAQGRINGITGPSGHGKSFIIGNVVKNALNDGFLVLVIDSEKAFDKEYLRNIGADVDTDNYLYINTSSIDEAAKQIHGYISDLRDALKTDPTLKMLIVIDSLDMLDTKQALEKFEESGELANDQGLKQKKHKQLLVNINQEMGNLPIAVLCSKQVYLDQNAGQNVSPIHQWKMAEAIKYVFSQIMLVTRLLDKNDKTKQYDGIKLRVFGYKTRFTKPYQQIELVIPWDKGLDPHEGILEAAASLNIITKNKGWYEFRGSKFQQSNAMQHMEAIFDELVALDNATITVENDDVIEDLEGASEGSQRSKRKATMKELVASKKKATSDTGGE